MLTAPSSPVAQPKPVAVRLLRKQQEFRACLAKWAGARGGKGSGKTTALAWWLIERLEAYPLASHYVAGATFPQLREGSFQTIAGILETVFGWGPGKDFIFREKSQSPIITFPHSGAQLTSITAEQGDKINSIEFQTLVCEEPQTWDRGETAFQTMVTRLRHSQQSAALYPDMVPSGRLSFNPPGQAHWLYDLIERRWPLAGYPCWQFSTRENVLMRGLDAYIAGLEAQTQPYLWPSEIDGDWRTASTLFFVFADLAAALDDALTKAMVTHRLDDYGRLAHAEIYADRAPWRSAYPESRYVHFWDLADKQDWTVGITIDATYGDRMTVVEFERFNRMGWKYVYERIRDRHQRYKTPSRTGKTYIDSTGVGDAVLDELKDIRAEGMKFTATSKPEMLAGLQSALSTRQLHYPMIPVMYDELRYYERDDKALVQDCVCALAGAVHFSRRRRFSGSAFV
jgi:hypothetical protein